MIHAIITGLEEDKLTSRDEIVLTEFSTVAAKNQLQIHDTESRSHNGEDSGENLITLRAECHEFRSQQPFLKATSAARNCEWIADSVGNGLGNSPKVFTSPRGWNCTTDLWAAMEKAATLVTL
jgi:hypothetical protein